MANQVSLEVATRTTLGKQVKQLRRQGIIPANLYGRHLPSQALQLEFHSLDRFLAGRHATRVVDLHLGGAKGEVYNALIRHITRKPRTGQILHVDFLRVSMSELMTVRVAVALKGTAPAVAVEGGVLLHLLDALEVECLPGDIPESLELDISGLISIDDNLYARDVTLLHGMKLISDADAPVVKVVAPRAVLAEEAAEAAAAEEKEAAAPAAAEAKSEGGSD